MDSATDSVARDLVAALLPVEIVVRPMFGGLCWYLDGKVLGLINDGAVFVKASSRDALLAGLADLSPAYPGATPSWRLRPGVLDVESDRLREAVQAIAAVLPRPKARKKRTTERGH
ncbi:MAG: TfoX/Sxy family protein [Propionibacteriaceae bacterium]|nr:TfoX/Sxy family protein [Micropruina sp.]HBX80912.1 hypothetical protein [Propionibacteriaceae bacterium]HBY22585.1 hypothetical protein [Propionibacteriaceae bacterium]